MKPIFPLLFLFFFLILSGCAKIDTVVTENMLVLGGEYWELLTIEGKPAGFQRTSLTFEEINGRSIKRFERQSRLIVLRHANVFDVSMKIGSVSQNGSGFESCNVLLNGGGEPIETSYRIENEKLVIDGKPNPAADWKPGTPGPEAILCELLRSPMKPDETRQLTFFEPAMQSCVDATLKAETIESVDLGNVTRKLLRISVRNRIKLPQIENQILSETLWSDARGNIVRREVFMDDKKTLCAVRVSKEKALALIETAPSVELGNLGVVPLNRSIPLPHSTDRFEFVVEVPNASLLNRFPNTPFQMVETINEKTLKITTTKEAEKAARSINDAKPEQSNPEDLASCPLIRLDDPQLLELAAKVDSNSLTPRQTAFALEKLVHETIRQTTFSVAFASSSDVLKSKSGDCTEFAVLLTALCRAKKIPARIVVGLVYVPFKHSNNTDGVEAGMAFHLWNEVFVDGIWQPLDATSALGGADAARIKIADDSLAENSVTPLCNSILGIVGQLQIRY